MSLLPGSAKNIFSKPKKSMDFDARIKSATFPAQPVTLAIVGCGQRGNVGIMFQSLSRLRADLEARHMLSTLN
jgi:hypothetical protein